MSQDQNSSSVPQVALTRAIEQAVIRAYGNSDVRIRVVRQHRNLQVGSLQFIDYAVPCFELARALKLQPEKVAQAVAEALQKRDSDSRPDVWQSEAVAGYVNIQLAPQYLAQAVGSVQGWFAGPAPQVHGADVFLLTGMEPAGPSEQGKLYIEAYRYIDQVYSLIKAPHSSRCLLNDFSEKMPHHLSQRIARQDPKLVPDMKERARLHQAVRRFFTDPQSATHDDGPVGQEFERLHTDMAASYDQLLGSQGITDYALMPESDTANETHACIDKLKSGPVGKGEFVKDEASFAVYYAEKDSIISLRSAEGLLHEAGYILCSLEKELHRGADKIRTIVVFAPTRLQQLILGYTAELSKRRDRLPRVVFFDAHVSRADIFQLQTAVPSVADHFQKVSKLLTDPREDWFNTAEQRQNLISFVDLPEALKKSMEAMQLPLFFDVLSESAEILERFND